MRPGAVLRADDGGLADELVARQAGEAQQRADSVLLLLLLLPFARLLLVLDEAAALGSLRPRAGDLCNRPWTGGFALVSWERFLGYFDEDPMKGYGDR